MDQDHNPREDSLDEDNGDHSGGIDAVSQNEASPPPPPPLPSLTPPPPPAPLPTIPIVDFAANAAMAKDILSVESGRAREPGEAQASAKTGGDSTPPGGPVPDESPEPPRHPAESPITPDFFVNSARPKKRFRLSK
jgi:hypothetical protein